MATLFKFILIGTAYIICLLPSPTLAQQKKFAIETNVSNLLYVFMSHDITSVAENIPCRDLILETDNGEIVSNGDCTFELVPHYIGRANIKVYSYKGKIKQKIGTKNYIVKSIVPYIEIQLSTGQEDSISLNTLKAQLGLIARITSFDINATVPISEFRVEIIRNGEQLYNHTNLTNRFDNETSRLLNQCKSGDQVVFRNIYLIEPGSVDSNKVLFDPVKLKVI